MGFPGGTGCSRQNRYGGYNTRTGAWVGPSPSTEPRSSSSNSDDWKKCPTCGCFILSADGCGVCDTKKNRLKFLRELTGLTAEAPHCAVADKLMEANKDAEAQEYLELTK